MFGALALAFVLAAQEPKAAETKPIVPAESLRPPAIPLVVHDPYFSIWSCVDTLTDDWPRHWTGRVQAMQSMVRIDGETFRLMGPAPEEVPALTQVDRRVTPTRTSYAFESESVRVELDFWSAAVPFDLEMLSRPATFVQWNVVSRDGASHEVSIHFDISAEACVDKPDQAVTWSRERFDGLACLRIGSQGQSVLLEKGDDRRIDWGWLYAAAPSAEVSHFAVASDKAARGAFVEGRALAKSDDERKPRAANDAWPVLAFDFDVGTVDVKRPALRSLILAYDDVRSIQYFDERLKGHWRRSGWEMKDLLVMATAQRPKLESMTQQFDREFRTACEKVGGRRYAEVATLAYRQCLAANKLCVDLSGRPLAFPKENFSNGCVATVDVIYPMAPLFLLFGADLAKSMLVPVLDYASSPRWTFPFAPHDLGTYPHATGQVYGGGEKTVENQMPVEESANLLILVAALTKVEGNATFAARYEHVLTQWAAYLRDKGFDPENQLCTDDFAGHLAHNVNLSAKAILALGAWSQILQSWGRGEEAKEWREITRSLAARWVQESTEGDKTKLAFDQPGSWSQKYNLVWDRVLELGLFPEEVYKREVAHYRRVRGPYGTPLDSRKTYTKLDWVMWSACLGTREDFEALTDPLWNYVNETESRVPMGDWYETTDGKVVQFVARPVVGAVLMPLLLDWPTWKGWFKRGLASSNEWAPIPIEASNPR